MALVKTSFAADTSGFEFVNFFELKLPVKFSLPLAGDIDLNQVVIGLCGGMCYTALDFYHAGRALPQYSRTDEIELPLMTYLCERQLDSLTIPVLIKIIDWMSQGDDELAGRVLRAELPRLRRSLDKGQPAVLCLIRSGAGGNMTHNHQVIATGYDLESTPGRIVIHLYDPNHPLEAPTITAGLSRADFQLRQSSGEVLRGFFVMPYKPQRAGLPLQAGVLGDLSFSNEPAAPVSEPPFRLRWPVDSRRVNQFFGENPETYRPFNQPGHEGIDFYALTGANIYASFDGTVTEVRYRGAYGNQVRIRHEHNGIKFTTVYAHLEKMLVEANQRVSAGEVIGLADNTGNSRGSHLHFTLFIDGQKTKGYMDGIVDPWFYFEGNEPPAPLTESGVVVYTIGEVNLRSLATTDSEILTRLPAGEQLPALGKADEVKKRIGQQGQWLQVKTAGGQSGFVAAWLTADQAGQVFAPSGLIVYPFDTCPLRSGPGLGLSSLGDVNALSPLNVMGSAESARAKIGQKDVWLQVLTTNGTQGFIPAWLVRVTGENPPSTGLFLTPTIDLNLRAAPSTTADIMAVTIPGDMLKVIGDKAQASAKVGRMDHWINVQAPNGVVGWVAAWFVKALPVQSGGSGTAPEPAKPQGDGREVFPAPDAGINLRSAPDIDAPRIDGALRNEPLTLLDSDLAAAQAKVGKADAWLYLQKTNGKRGWAAAWNLSNKPV